MTTPAPRERAKRIVFDVSCDSEMSAMVLNELEDAGLAIIDAAELSALRAEVEGLTAERDHYRVAVRRLQRIIAGLRRAVVCWASIARATSVCMWGANRIAFSSACELQSRAFAIRAAAKRGEYRKP